MNNHISSYIGIGIVFIVILFFWVWVWRFVAKAPSWKARYLEALEKHGLEDPLIRHLDEEDWVGYGEATLHGRRVRFNTNRRPDRTIRLMLSSATGLWPEGKLPEGTLDLT